MLMNSVIVFGDSLSDIGRKWTTKSGKTAIKTNQMFVSPNGRFSDCRNWTDFMVEAATGRSLVVNSASGTIALSKMHINLSEDSVFDCNNPFQYANYAEGGACGDTPASKSAFLGTFKGQVDWFEEDLKKTNLTLGNTLFIAWFGANDLYTAERKPEQMHLVAEAVANTQRNRLVRIAAKYQGTARFVFVNLARALTSVRYTRMLMEAETALNTALKIGRAVPTQARASNLWHAQQSLNAAANTGLTPSYLNANARALKSLQDKVALVKKLETGVMNYNTHLALKVTGNNDALAEIGNVISEETIARLVEGNFGLKDGAKGIRSAHVGSSGYDTSVKQHTTTIDEVHPTDQMYKVIWEEIYETLKRANLTFGNLVGTPMPSTLATLSGPSAAVRGKFNKALNQMTRPRAIDRQNFNAVMAQLKDSQAQ